MFTDIEFETTTTTDPDELLIFYKRQGHVLTCSRDKLLRMVDSTVCFVTARCRGELIGLARGVSDGVWGHIADCKLDPAFQGPGCITKTAGRIEHDAGGIAAEMARRLIEALRKFGVERIDLLAHGTEMDFCKELGFRKMRGVVAMELVTRAESAAAPHVAAEAVR